MAKNIERLKKVLVIVENTLALIETLEFDSVDESIVNDLLENFINNKNLLNIFNQVGKKIVEKKNDLIVESHGTSASKETGIWIGAGSPNIPIAIWSDDLTNEKIKQQIQAMQKSIIDTISGQI